jgi:hypothetical protein
MASLNVGTGECHVVRQGDSIAVFDVGTRYSEVEEDDIIFCLEGVMSHKIRQSREIATLEGVFVTHPHNDHFNLLKSMLDGEIKCSRNFRVYLGGTYKDYPGSFINSLNNKNYIEDRLTNYFTINDFTVSGGNVSILDKLETGNSNDYGGMFFLDCFKKRRIAFLGDINRFSLEMIGSPILYNGYSLENKYILSNRHQAADRESLYENLIWADIFTGPHHASLSNEEAFVYGALASNGEKGNRICITSTSPIKKHAMPTITPILLDSFKGYASIFEHSLTCDCGINDTTAQPVFKTQNITMPIFSTYDAIGGFILTQIESNGKVSVYNDLTSKFEMVLPAAN